MSPLSLIIVCWVIIIHCCSGAEAVHTEQWRKLAQNVSSFKTVSYVINNLNLRCYELWKVASVALAF